MVVVHRAHGYRLVIYTFDHEPAHVHITGAGKGKIQLVGFDGRPELIYATDIKRPDLKRLMRDVAENQAYLIELWERIHGKS